ncbi:DUF86 domain-containing protein [Nitratifractor sp.]|uniref:type VII toxin-antitoxin system HepT family RNase toxin n=1 Tax=Nitratifractor sp. TaxID=2268144 RepID=UPI0025F9C135|nr:DUF86 domain-containing protein [Nitratifractor sp.]
MQLSDKLKRLETNLNVLKEVRNEIHSPEMLEQNIRYEWEVRYGLLESIQIVIDIACKISARFNLGNPGNYKECLELLAQHGYIDRDLMQNTTAMVGLRNLLVHEYTRLDRKRLFEYLDHLEDFHTFIREITEHFLPESRE